MTTMCERIYVTLNISSQQLIHYYTGTVSTVVAHTINGQTIRFPANILRSVVQADGVHGMFELAIDEHHKFISIKRVRNQ